MPTTTKLNASVLLRQHPPHIKRRFHSKTMAIPTAPEEGTSRCTPKAPLTCRAVPNRHTTSPVQRAITPQLAAGTQAGAECSQMGQRSGHSWEHRWGGRAVPSIPSMLGAASYSSDTGLLRASGDGGGAQRKSGQGLPGLGWGLLGTGSA